MIVGLTTFQWAGVFVVIPLWNLDHLWPKWFTTWLGLLCHGLNFEFEYLILKIVPGSRSYRLIPA